MQRLTLPEKPTNATLGKTTLTGVDRPMRLALESGDSLHALLAVPPSPVACQVFAHGAGAGIDHAFKRTVATGLAERRITTLGYRSPFADPGGGRCRSPGHPAAGLPGCRTSPAASPPAGGRGSQRIDSGLGRPSRAPQ